MSLNATIEEMMTTSPYFYNPESYNITKNNVLQIHHSSIIFDEHAEDWSITWDECIINSRECIRLETRKNDENIWYWKPCRDAKFRVIIIGFKDAAEEERWQRETYEKLKEVSE